MDEIIAGMFMGARWKAHIMRGMDGAFHARVVIGQTVRVTGRHKDFEECKQAARKLAGQTVIELRGGGGKSDGQNAAAS